MTLQKIKITDAVVARAQLPAGKTEAVLWDADVVGFGLRLRDGAKTWVVSYRVAGEGRAGAKKRYRLGTPASIPTAAEARRLARAVLGKVAAGADPAAERALTKRRAQPRVRDLLDAYDRDLDRRGYVNRAMVVSGLRTRLAPVLDRDVATVTGAELAAIVERLAAAGKRGAAEEFRSRARTFFGYCQIKAKVIPTNPLAGFRKERATKADRLTKAEHGRALSDAELVRVWRAADPDTVFGRVVRYLALTGCRRGEGVALTWSMIDRPAALIRLPAALTKQGREHVVPITPLIADVLDACTVTAGSDLVFASVKTGGPISGWRPMREVINKASRVQFTLHDLRRTFRTGLARLGIPDALAELAIAHARKDLEARYNRDAAAAGIRDAFEAWGRHVAELLAADDVKRTDEREAQA